MKKIDLIYAAMACAGAVGMIYAHSVQWLVGCSMLTMGAWILHISDRMSRDTDDLRKAIEDLSTLMGPPPTIY